MKTAKQEFIRKCYTDAGFSYYTNKNNIDEQGWIDVCNIQGNFISQKVEYKEYTEYENNSKSTLVRPIALRGFEVNNGWNNVNDILPEKMGYYICILSNGHQTTQKYSIGRWWHSNLKENISNRVTHWRNQFDTPIY